MSSLDKEEVEKFSKIADEWWDLEGKFKLLHQINPLRLRYIRDNIIEHLKLNVNKNQPFEGLNILDIGSGGGLLCEPMARLGANMHGIDAAEENINIAKIHAQKSGLDINYQQGLIEEVEGEYKEYFDVILNMEIIEHVANPEDFLESCLNCLKPGGLMVVSTINRTPLSYLKTILGAEYILRWLPVGTHDWRKFLKPSEIAAIGRRKNSSIHAIKGMNFSVFTRDWSFSDKIDSNYIMTLHKS